ncbi:unnamed protein product, partial [Darwinula stevensoni]
MLNGKDPATLKIKDYYNGHLPDELKDATFLDLINGLDPRTVKLKDLLAGKVFNPKDLALPKKFSRDISDSIKNFERCDAWRYAFVFMWFFLEESCGGSALKGFSRWFLPAFFGYKLYKNLTEKERKKEEKKKMKMQKKKK